MPDTNLLAVHRWRDLVINLVRKEIKLRYMGATLGFIWSLGNPLVVTLTYYFVFTYILPNEQDRFALHLVTGVVHWMLLSMLLQQSCEWLTNNSGLIRKIYFPRILLPLASGMTVGVFWLAAMAVYAVTFPLLGGILSQAILWYPLVLVSFIAFIAGLGLSLSIAQISIRDTKHLVDVFLPLFFWLTPIVWMTSSLSPDIAHITAFNPLAPYFNSFTAIFHASVEPRPLDLALCALLGAASLTIGLHIFKKADRLVEHL